MILRILQKIGRNGAAKHPQPSNEAQQNERQTLEDRWSLINHLSDRHQVNIDYEHVLSNLSKEFLNPGDWVLDIGAHSGRHTRVFAESIGPEGRMIAIEPLEYCAQGLASEMADRSNVTVLNCAVSNFSGDADFIAALGTPEESGLKQKVYILPEQANPQTITVEVKRVDDIVADWNRLDYIKMDIEGGELDCLEGAETTVTKLRPLISFECGRAAYEAYGRTADDFLEWARHHNYDIIDLFGHRLSDGTLFKAVVDRARTWDFFFVPAESCKPFQEKIGVSPLP